MTPEQEKQAEKYLLDAMMCRQLTTQQRELARVFLQSLIHYRDTSVGLWVTDKPKSFDEKKLAFKLKF